MKTKMNGNGNKATTNQQKSEAAMSKRGELRREINALEQEEISRRAHVIYALRADPDYSVFDAELLDPSEHTLPAEWWEWEAVAVVSGGTLHLDKEDVHILDRGGSVKLSAQQVLAGEGSDIKVTLL